MSRLLYFLNDIRRGGVLSVSLFHLVIYNVILTILISVMVYFMPI